MSLCCNQYSIPFDLILNNCNYGNSNTGYFPGMSSSTVGGLPGPPGPPGPPGRVGPQGPPGANGAGLNILGALPDVTNLPSSANSGDAYVIGGDIYVWNAGSQSWINAGSVGEMPTIALSIGSIVTLPSGSQATASLTLV